MARLLIALLFILLSTNVVFANDIDNFVGKWSVHVEKTFREAKKHSPKFNPKTAEKDRKMLRQFAGAMQIELSKSSISYFRGKRSTVFPYKIISSTPSSFSAEVVTKDNFFTLSFTLRNGVFLNMKSSGSDDMNYYIWQKSIEGQNADSETKVISNIISNK